MAVFQFERIGNVILSPIAHRLSLENLAIDTEGSVNADSFTAGPQFFGVSPREDPFLRIGENTDSWVGHLLAGRADLDAGVCADALEQVVSSGIARRLPCLWTRKFQPFATYDRCPTTKAGRKVRRNPATGEFYWACLAFRENT